MMLSMNTDRAHIEAITTAIAAAIADTDSTVGPQEIKAIVDAEWTAQTERTMRALMQETDS